MSVRAKSATMQSGNVCDQYCTKHDFRACNNTWIM